MQFSPVFHFRGVKRNFISHRFVYTRVKVYRAVILAVAGFSRRYFACAMQGWKVRFRCFGWT